jgi:MFS family permease
MKSKTVLFALLGSAFIAVYIWIASESKIARLLHHQVPKNQILELADLAISQTEFLAYDLPKKVELSIDNHLLRFAQLNLNGQTDSLPIGQWEIAWRGQIHPKKEGPQDVSFVVKYDFKGTLIGLEQNSPNLKKPPNFKEEEAVAEALRFLYALKIDTTSIAQKNKIINKEDRALHYNFTFSKPSLVSPRLQENYYINISGRNITQYTAKTTIEQDESDLEQQKTSEMVYLTAMFVVWTVLSIFLISIFFKRLKHDLLEFKRAFWLGVAVFIFMFIYLATEAWPNWREMLIGGGLAGFFTGLGILIVYSVTESLSREIWPEKLSLADVLIKGHVRVREFGAALLNSLFIAGSLLLIFAALFWVAPKLNIGYLHLYNDVLWIFNGNGAILPNILKNLVSSFYIGLILFLFWLAYLRSKIANNLVLVVVFGLIINLAGLDLYYLRASYLVFLLFLPIAVIWAYFVFKFDLITVLLAFFVVNLFLEISLVSLLPAGIFSAPSIVAWSMLFIMLVCGSYLISSKTSIGEFEHYVPAYVSRIAQRERFLKELEIARSVQQRFLPQSVPQFPHLDIACICRPAMEVGGDYYDFIRDGNRSLGILIGDVSGKGVSAAFYMTMVKGIIKTLARSTLAPKKMLTEMNTIFYENVPREVFISIVYGLFDLEKKTLTFARAGHNPIIVRKSSSQQPEMLNSKGLAIGLEKGKLFPDTIEEITLPIESGDLFVFFTDGISESKNLRGDEFGEDNLQRVIAESVNSSAQMLLDTITQKVSRFAGTAVQHDDFTMVVVKVVG